jgi:hypothetical protein
VSRWGGIRWAKDAIGKARELGYPVVAFGFTDKHLKNSEGINRFGSLEFCGPMDPRLADPLLKFFIDVRTGKSPREAFDAAGWPEENSPPTP